jgi:hypothetical protein
MRSTWALAALTTSLTFVAGTAGARPAQEAQRLGDPSVAYLFSLDPAMATAPAGRSVALVASGRRLVVRRAAPGLAFEPADRIAGRTEGPAVESGDELTAMAWTHFDHSYVVEPGARDEDCCMRLRAATLDARGRMGQARELSAPGVSVEDARAVVRGRRAAVAWQDGRGVRASTTRERGARFGPPKTLARPADELLGLALTGSGPHAFLLRGAAVVEVWRAGGHTQHRVIGRFETDAHPVRSAVSPTGALIIASTAPDNPRLGTRLQVAYRRPGAGLRQHIVRYGRRVGISEMAVTLSPSGGGLIAITQPARVVVRPVGDDGLGHPFVVRGLPVRRNYPSDLALAQNARGEGVLGALVGTASADGAERTQTVAWALAAGGRPLRRHILSFARRTFGPQEGVTVTIDAAGRRRVAWAEDAGVFAVRLR